VLIAMTCMAQGSGSRSPGLDSSPYDSLDATPQARPTSSLSQPELWGMDLPTGVKAWLNNLHPTQPYRWLADQVAYIGQSRKLWVLAPSPGHQVPCASIQQTSPYRSALLGGR
jgi:hypothetical protein